MTFAPLSVVVALLAASRLRGLATGRREPMSDMTSTDKAPVGSDKQLRQYNHEHFWFKHIFADVWRSVKGAGLRPGDAAPDFELPSADGGTVTLGGFIGRPVLIHIAARALLGRDSGSARGALRTPRALPRARPPSREPRR